MSSHHRRDSMLTLDIDERSPAIRRSHSSPDRLPERPHVRWQLADSDGEGCNNPAPPPLSSRAPSGWARGSLQQSLAEARRQAQVDSEAERLAEVAAARIDIRKPRSVPRWLRSMGDGMSVRRSSLTFWTQDPSTIRTSTRFVHMPSKQGKVTQALADADRAVAMAPLSARAHNACARAPCPSRRTHKRREETLPCPQPFATLFR